VNGRTQTVNTYFEKTFQDFISISFSNNTGFDFDNETSKIVANSLNAQLRDSTKSVLNSSKDLTVKVEKADFKV